jgi:hypothetical protein
MGSYCNNLIKGSTNLEGSTRACIDRDGSGDITLHWLRGPEKDDRLT